MEIEKKYIINELPFSIDSYTRWDIEQGYLCGNPTLRIRKKNNEYIFTYKCRKKGVTQSVAVNEEIELPLTREAYNSLITKIEGYVVEKKRYLIPFDEKHTIELDVFEGRLKGLVLAEVEFESIEASEEFVAPEWFGADVSRDKRFTNRSLSKIEKFESLENM